MYIEDIAGNPLVEGELKIEAPFFQYLSPTEEEALSVSGTLLNFGSLLTIAITIAMLAFQ